MSGDFTQTHASLVDKILEQGQRLRNAMVQSILQNDPLNTEVLGTTDKKYNTPASSGVSLSGGPTEEKNIVQAFLNGDYLTKREEESALSSIRSMHGTDICRATERTLFSKCSCSTCTAYHTENLKCDLRRENKAEKDVFEPQKPKFMDSSISRVLNSVLKQVDSLKVVLQSINLNSLGEKKVSQGLNKLQNSYLNETYFVEYCIPEVFIQDVIKSKSKVDSGLANNHIKVCSRRTSNVIYLKQTFIHSVCNFYNHNLEEHDLTFVIRYKSSSQKKPEQLGIAKFNFGLFGNCKNASCGQTLPIFLAESSMISVGTLKVTVQLGAGRLYFGQEFLDAVLQKKDLQSASSSDDDISSVKDISIVKIVPNNLEVKLKDTQKKRLQASEKADLVNNKERTNSLQFKESKYEVSQGQLSHTEKKKKDSVLDSVAEIVTLEAENELLFGFFYISEAQFLNNNTPNSFIKLQPYCQSSSSISRVVYGNSNALYNFCQIVPLLYEQDLLLKLRENVMVVEFWEKTSSTEQIFGLTRLPLHQFYLGYRNGVILKHLKRNKLPVIGTDWWEPIYSVDDNELIGQVQVLTALGTEEQIRNLQLERGFKDESVKAKLNVATSVKENNSRRIPTSYFADRAQVNKKSFLKHKLSHVNHSGLNISPPLSSKKGPANCEILKVDVGVQSGVDVKKMESKSAEASAPQMLDTMTSFLKLLEKSQKPPSVENSTNTEPVVSSGTSSTEITSSDLEQGPQLRKTSDLLDSLQKALSLDSRPSKKVDVHPHFKTEIFINEANQLPSRRKVKSKSKKTKGKSPRHEESILPSTYVTFETMPGEPLKLTNVFPKSTAPKWNFRCLTYLPMDLVTNVQKRLIFKVWKKCTNAILQPNMQTDLVLGFAAVDLSVLSMGMPNVQGWFNIIDFSGKCNGQINIHINPIDKLDKNKSQDNHQEELKSENEPLLEFVESDECNELLGRALKRKFSELDEITQRLRLRLSEVVSEDSDGANDDMTEEFEHDINNLCIEEDFDLIDFEEEARKFNINYNNQKAENKSSSVSSVDTQPGPSTDRRSPAKAGEIKEKKSLDEGAHSEQRSGLLMEDKDTESKDEASVASSVFCEKNLAEGKHRIDSLLEKLTLLTSEASQPFSTRYVSGCSTDSHDANDIQDIFKDLDQHSRPNITAANNFDPVLFQQLYGGSASDTSTQDNVKVLTINCQPSKTDMSRLTDNNEGLKLELSSSTSSGGGSSSEVCVNTGSETSVITNFSDCRPTPDGDGTTDEKK